MPLVNSMKPRTTMICQMASGRCSYTCWRAARGRALLKTSSLFLVFERGGGKEG